jgi:hypothetical protein
MEATGDKFGRYRMATATDSRVVIQLTSIRATGTLVLFPINDDKTLEKYDLNDTILWSLSRVRLREATAMRSTEKDLSEEGQESFTTPEESFFTSTMTREGLIELMDEFTQDTPGSPVFENDLETTFNELNSRLNVSEESSVDYTMIVIRMYLILIDRLHVSTT